jgi:hypothetical protein
MAGADNYTWVTQRPEGDNMSYVNLVRSATGPCASLQIPAAVVGALPPAFKQQLLQFLQQYNIPMPSTSPAAPFDPNGGPVCVLVADQIAIPLCVRLENLIRQGLSGS